MKIKFEYPFTIRRLTKEEGGGFLIEYPDLPGCMSDGETIEEALKNGQDAAQCWLASAQKNNMKIPTPTAEASGRWLQRVPKSLHQRLTSRAKKEGVSLNSLVISFLSEGLAHRL